MDLFSCMMTIQICFFIFVIYLSDTNDTQMYRGQEQEEGLTNYIRQSNTNKVAGATPLTNPHNQTNHRIHFQSRKRLYIHKCPFVCPSGSKTHQKLEIIIFHPSSFIIHHSSLISRLLSFSACLLLFLP